MGIDALADFYQGYEDARNDFPRESTRPHYRRGYDRGLTERIVRPVAYVTPSDNDTEVAWLRQRGRL